MDASSARAEPDPTDDKPGAREPDPPRERRPTCRPAATELKRLQKVITVTKMCTTSSILIKNSVLRKQTLKTQLQASNREKSFANEALFQDESFALKSPLISKTCFKARLKQTGGIFYPCRSSTPRYEPNLNARKNGT